MPEGPEKALQNFNMKRERKNHMGDEGRYRNRVREIQLTGASVYWRLSLNTVTVTTKPQKAQNLFRR